MNRSEAIATIQHLEGQGCIFKDKLLIRHVKVTEALVDDWGARFRLEVLMTPGFGSELFSTLNVSASWEVIALSDRAIGASYVSWLLVIRPDLVDRILLFAAQSRNEVELMNYANKAAYDADSDWGRAIGRARADSGAIQS